jgi:type IV pilus assembly protein PilA
MLKNKKGFTLVELLAVIVILAIILAIAVPGISGIINSAKKGSFESDAKMMVTGIEYNVLQSTVTGSAAPVASDTAITANVGDYGADPANYTDVYIVNMNPITICVESAAGSEFGAFAATATKSGITYLVAPDTTCALYVASH